MENRNVGKSVDRKEWPLKLEQIRTAFRLFGGKTVSEAQLAIIEMENKHPEDGFDSFSEADHEEYQAWIDSLDSWE